MQSQQLNDAHLNLQPKAARKKSSLRQNMHLTNKLPGSLFRWSAARRLALAMLLLSPLWLITLWAMDDWHHLLGS